MQNNLCILQKISIQDAHANHFQLRNVEHNIVYNPCTYEVFEETYDLYPTFLGFIVVLFISFVCGYFLGKALKTNKEEE